MNKSSKKFYILDETYTSFAEIVPLDYESITTECSKCGTLFSERKSELQVKIVGKKIGDYYHLVHEKVISNKLSEILDANSFTGYITNHIELLGFFDSRGNSLPNSGFFLKELVITGRCGLLRYSNGKLIKGCSQCGIVPVDTLMDVVGISVSEEEWDGSDMFYFKNWVNGLIIVTERLKKEIEKSNLKNITFTEITEFKFSPF